MMMWLITAIQIIFFSQLCTQGDEEMEDLDWYHRPVVLGYVDQDLYFDRIHALVLYDTKPKTGVLLGIGVLINSELILTSFNPFRRHIRNVTVMSKLYVQLLFHRIMIKTNRYTDLMTTEIRIACGRQIQDLPDDEISKGDLWHGMDKRHCPLHDLLVFRMAEPLRGGELGPNHKIQIYTPDKAPMTKLAKPFEMMSSSFKFCYVYNRYLKVIYYHEDHNAVVDCDEWLPRDWGHFICILNKDNHTEVTSGAMLVSHNTLFGVASFVLFRDTQSIIVFTDIRPYNELIFKTCTKDDSNEKLDEDSRP